LGRDPEILHLDALVPSQERGALDTLLELAHVPWPGVLHECREHGIGERERWLPERSAFLIDEASSERHDLRPAPPQRRDTDRDPVEPMVEIITKGPRLTLRDEVTVRGADVANV